MRAAALLVAAALVAAASAPALAGQPADAGAAPSKFHFTQTLGSSPDPGIGREGGQLALVLSPSAGSIYDGSMTYAASEPVEAVVLHEIGEGHARGQPTWTVDGEAHYAVSAAAPAASGSLEFTGAALALRTQGGPGFAATVSADGWIRGQPTEVVIQAARPAPPAPELKLARSTVPAELPLREGLHGGGRVLYVATDSSDEGHAELITGAQGWRVEHAPPLAGAPDSALAAVYVFADGVEGAGLRGYQAEVFSSTPAQAGEYSALRAVSSAEWKAGQSPEVLGSEEEVLAAEEAGRIELEETGAVVNMPHVVWPGGRLAEGNATAGAGEPYGRARVYSVDEENMTATFAAHRAWGPDGRTIYHIVADATPAGPAAAMGAVHAPSSAGLAASAAAVDLFQFGNGVAGPGPLGFQPSVASAAPGDGTYSPMWRVYVVEWDDPAAASVLGTRADIDALSGEEAVSVSLARPLNSVHIVNGPVVDPFQRPAGP